MIIAVLGGGLAAESFLYFASRLFPKDVELIQIEDSVAYPPCTLSSTAVASLRGASRGFSPLGDLIVDGMEFLLEFIQHHQPEGAEFAPHFQVWSLPDERKEQRFFGVHRTDQLSDINIRFPSPYFVSREQAVVFTPALFLSWLKHQRARSIPKIEGTIRGLDFLDNSKMRIDILGHESVFANVVVNCLGYGAKINQLFFPQDKLLARTSNVWGSYLEWKKIEMPSSFSLTLNESNAIYRRQTKTLQIGVANGEGAHFKCLDEKQLTEHIGLFNKLFPVPSITQAEIKTGVRHKGVKRQLFADRVVGHPDHLLYGLYGLYKNGFSCGLYSAHQLSMKVASEF